MASTSAETPPSDGSSDGLVNNIGVNVTAATSFAALSKALEPLKSWDYVRAALPPRRPHHAPVSPHTGARRGRTVRKKSSFAIKPARDADGDAALVD